MSDIISSFVEVTLKDSDDFLKIKETLTRIGVASKVEKKLTQSCHILHKQGLYYLVHFKELFALDGKDTDFSEEDVARRNAIAKLLEEWELLKIVNPKKIETPIAPISSIKIISYKEKKDWVLTSKYNIGKKR
jgi:hypothetical protein